MSTTSLTEGRGRRQPIKPIAIGMDLLQLLGICSRSTTLIPRYPPKNYHLGEEWDKYFAISPDHT